MLLPRAEPRLMLQAPHTTSMSWSRMGLPCSFLSHASGEWSAWRSSRRKQSEQKGWSRRARFESFCQFQS